MELGSHSDTGSLSLPSWWQQSIKGFCQRNACEAYLLLNEQQWAACAWLFPEQVYTELTEPFAFDRDQCVGLAEQEFASIDLEGPLQPILSQLSLKHVLCCAICGPKGQVIGLILVASDSAQQDLQLSLELVKLQRDLERKLAQSLDSSPEAELFPPLFESSGIGQAVIDAAGDIELANPAFASLFGYPLVELDRQSFWQLIDPRFRKQLRYWHSLRLSPYQGKIPQRFECQYLTQDGANPWLLLFVSPLPNAPRFALTALDISHRKRVEAELSLAAKVFNHTYEGMLITDADNRIIQVNAAFCQITGYQQQELLGQSPSFLASGFHDAEFYQEMWQQINETGQWHGEIYNRRKNGEVYPELLTISRVCDKNQRLTHYVGAFSDISKLKRSEERLRYLANHDVLTDLPNRLMLSETLAESIVQAQRNENMLALAFIDVDHFKNVNDSLGHATGDALLQQIAKRLLQSLRKSDHLARLGGDEFVVLLQNVSNQDSVVAAINKLVSNMEEPFTIEGHNIHVTLSVGVSIYPQDGDEVGTLLRNADAAMYRAKECGRNNYQFYTKELTTKAFEQLLLENALQQALQQQQLRLCYQPLLDMEQQSVTGFEALLRWQHPELGEVSPSRFIPVAEKTGLIIGIGEWVIQQVCQQGRQWLNQGLFFSSIAVNVSSVQLQRPDFAKRLAEMLERSGFPAHKLELELTETVLMQQSDHNFAVLAELKKLGVSLAIDDFGTGYSSLSYLSRLPLDKLKIDRSFVTTLLESKQNSAIADAVLSLGQALGVEVLAEGIEKAEQAGFMQQRHCRYAQGYYFSPPLEAEQVSAYCQSYSHKPH